MKLLAFLPIFSTFFVSVTAQISAENKTMMFGTVSVAASIPAKTGYCREITGKPFCQERIDAMNRPSVSLIKGNGQVAVFVNYVYNTSSKDINDNPINATQIASFFPVVDKYSMLTVPASTLILLYTRSYPLVGCEKLTEDSKDINIPQVYVELFVGKQRYQTTPKGYAITKNGVRFIPGRTVVIELDKGWSHLMISYIINQSGAVKSFDWAPTSCKLSTAVPLDGMCTEPLPASGQGCDVTVRVAWAGTDKDNKFLKSFCTSCSSFYFPSPNTF